MAREEEEYPYSCCCLARKGRASGTSATLLSLIGVLGVSEVPPTDRRRGGPVSSALLPVKFQGNPCVMPVLSCLVV